MGLGCVCLRRIQMYTLEAFNNRGAGKLPGYLGIVFTHAGSSEIVGELALKEVHMAPNGYLHAGSIVTLADTCCGYGSSRTCRKEPRGLRPSSSNPITSARPAKGPSSAAQAPVHLGRTTQVWDAVVTHKESGRTIALFRCTQLILYPKQG